MERIGIASSKIAKGNLVIYNLFVVLLSTLFSILVFFISGCFIVVTLILVAYLSNKGMTPDLEEGWIPMMVICMICLAVVTMIFNLCAILKNIKLKKN